MKRYKLGDIAPIKQGKFKSTEDSVWLLNLDMVEANTGKIIDFLYIDKNEIGLSTISFDCNNVLYSKLRPYLNKVVLPTKCGMATSEMLPLMPNSSIITRKYLTYFLRSKGFVDYINIKTSGAKMPRVNISDLKSAMIPCPTIAEQDLKTESLDRICAIISLRKEQLTALDTLIKSRFIEMFGDMAEKVPLSYYISELRGGKSLAGDTECTNKVLCTGSVSYDSFNGNEVKNLPPNYVPDTLHKVNTGDILISRMNTVELVGAAAYVFDAPLNTYIPDRLWKAKVTDGNNPIFVWQVLIQPTTKEKIRSRAGGTSGSMKNISKEKLLNIEVPRANKTHQNEFAAFVAQVDKSKFAVQQALDEAQVLFDSLMQQYFG